MEDPNIVDEYFKRRLQQAEEELPASSWQAIKNKLPAKSTAWNGNNNATTKKNIIGLVLLLLVFGSTFWYVTDLRNKNIALKNKLSERSFESSVINEADRLSDRTPSDAHSNPKNTIYNSEINSSNNESEATNSSTIKPSQTLSKGGKEISNKEQKSFNPSEKRNNHDLEIQKEDYSILSQQRETGRRLKRNSNTQLAIAAGQSSESVKQASSAGTTIGETSSETIYNSEKTKVQPSSIVGSAQLTVKASAGAVPERNSSLGNKAKKSFNIVAYNSENPRVAEKDSIGYRIASTPNEALKQILNTPITTDTISSSDTLLAKENTKEQINVKEQKKGTSVSSRPAISVEYFVAPDLAYSSVAYSGAPLSKAAQEYKKNDQNRVGFSTGLLLNLNLNKRFYIQTGLIYTNAGDKNNSNYQWKKTDTTLVGYNISSTKNDPDQITTLSDSAVKFKYMMPSNSILISSTTQQDSLNQNKITSYQTYSNNINSNDILVYKIKVNEYVNSLNQQARNSISYLGIPLVLGTRQVLSKRFSVGIFSGVITNILVSPKKIKAYSYLESEYSEKIIEKEIALNKLNFVYWGGVDICYNLSTQWSIRVAPVVKHALNSLYKDEVILRQVPYSYGIQLGVKYIFVDHK